MLRSTEVQQMHRSWPVSKLIITAYRAAMKLIPKVNTRNVRNYVVTQRLNFCSGWK